MLLEFAAIAVAVLLALVLWGRHAYARERQLKRSGKFSLQFIFVADDGSAHELSESQTAYLNSEFHPADGARPYFKSSYSKLTPAGNIGGYLKRSRLPKNVPIQKPPCEGP